MNYKIGNDKIEITARSHGGEIISAKSKQYDREYLWNGDPEYWKYSAPILFPIIGKVKNGKYKVDGKEYELPRHGLARVSEFEMVKKTDNELTFELKYSDESLKVYPYKFLLQSNYKIEDNKVFITYSVQNIDDKKIYFSLGSHIAYMCDITSDESKNSYLQFEKHENSDRLKLSADGFMYNKKEECLKDTDTIKLKKELFKDDALIFDDLKSDYIKVKSPDSDRELKMNFKEFPYLAIWSPMNEGQFISIEPWFGHADYDDFDDEFCKKEGSVALDVNKKFRCTFSIELN